MIQLPPLLPVHRVRWPCYFRHALDIFLNLITIHHRMFPVLATPRFILRQIVGTDQPVIFEGLSHPEVTRYYGVSYATLEATSAQMDFYNDLLLDKTGVWWAICHKETPDEMIGACGFNYYDATH